MLAVGFIALMLPRMIVSRADYGIQASAFAPICSAAIFGTTKGGVLAFLVTHHRRAGIRYAMALTLPRKAVGVMGVMSIIRAGALIAMVRF